jgi:uroporphyrin-3 C-methyltransferase
MSDKDIDQAAADAAEDKPDKDHAAEDQRSEEKPVAEETEAQPDEAPEPPVSASRRSGAANSVAWLAFLLAVVALAAAGYTGWQSWRTAADTSADDRVARLESGLSSSASSMAELLEQVNALSRRDPGIDDTDLEALRADLEQRLRMLESLPTRMSTLESSIASLAGVSEGARDAWVLAEAEYYLQLANAQLQLANNPRLAALALRMADERIVQLADPGLTDVRRALADELAALDVMDKPDIEGATLTLASLARVVESLPLAGGETGDEGDAEIDPELSGAGRAWASVKNAMSGLVRVTPPDRARLVQLSPDAEYFLRSNIALQLQAARLALLRGEQAIFEQTLDDTSALLTDYFDTDSTQVAGALETLAEVRSNVFTAEVPDISESLRLLRQFRTLSESAQ